MVDAGLSQKRPDAFQSAFDETAEAELLENSGSLLYFGAFQCGRKSRHHRADFRVGNAVQRAVAFYARPRRLPSETVHEADLLPVPNSSLAVSFPSATVWWRMGLSGFCQVR